MVFDWDDVVFNTAAFKESMANALEEQGVPRRIVMKTFAIAKDAHGYDPAIHAGMIIEEVGGSRTKITRMIWADCRSLAEKLLFPDAVKSILDIHKAGIPLYVLSAGRRQFQKARIFGSGLTHAFQDIHIVDVTSPDAAVATKAKILARLTKKHENLIFLDDRHKTIRGIQKTKELKNKVLPILVWRNKKKPPRGLVAVTRLSWQEIRKIAIHKGFGPY